MGKGKEESECIGCSAAILTSYHNQCIRDALEPGASFSKLHCPDSSHLHLIQLWSSGDLYWIFKATTL